MLWFLESYVHMNNKGGPVLESKHILVTRMAQGRAWFILPGLGDSDCSHCTG